MKKIYGLLLVPVFLALAVGSVLAYGNSVTYTGQGLIADGFKGYDLRTELCGSENGADVDGPYLLWVLTATGATKADITFSSAIIPNILGPDFGTHAMTKSGNGTFKYISGWHDPSTLPGN